MEWKTIPSYSLFENLAQSVWSLKIRSVVNCFKRKICKMTLLLGSTYSTICTWCNQEERRRSPTDTFRIVRTPTYYVLYGTSGCTCICTVCPSFQLYFWPYALFYLRWLFSLFTYNQFFFLLLSEILFKGCITQLLKISKCDIYSYTLNQTYFQNFCLPFFYPYS